MLRDFYYSDDRRVESAVLCLEEAEGSLDPSAKLSSVKAAQKFFSEDRERGFEAKVWYYPVPFLEFAMGEHERCSLYTHSSMFLYFSFR